MNYLRDLEDSLDSQDKPLFLSFRSSSEVLHRLFREQQPLEVIATAMNPYFSALEQLFTQLSARTIGLDPQEGNRAELQRIIDGNLSLFPFFVLDFYRRNHSTWKERAYALFAIAEQGLLEEIFRRE